LIGDRDGELGALGGRSWDAVIDTCGYTPRVVRASAEALAEAVQSYVFISSISVYASFAQPGMTEEAELATMADESVEEITGETYGPLKALCEKEVEEIVPGRMLIIRPGLIVGPHDVSDRFSYWPYRAAQGGEVLAPGLPETPVQIIDVRDLAEWTVRLVEQKAIGVFHATGPDYRLSMGGMLDSCRAAIDSEAHFTWVDDAFLVEQGVGAWIEMPLWIPAGPEVEGFSRVDVSKAIDAGLVFRPLADTARDTLEWLQTRPEDYVWRAGMEREKEARLLALWREENPVGQ
jgi:2'-hydroxyisoflavone reductase